MILPIIIVLCTVLFIRFIEQKEHPWLTIFFNWIPSILLAYLIPAGISAGIQKDFSGADIHNLSKALFIPLAIVAVMSSLSLTQLKSIGWKPILVFLSGSFWIAVFPIGLLLLFRNSAFVQDFLITQEFWKGIPPVVGSWIGGSTSQLVLKELVACSEAVFLTILVLDNILVNIWTIFMFQSIKKSNSLNRLLRIDGLSPPDSIQAENENKINPLLASIILLGSVGMAHFFIASFVVKIVVLSFVGIALSNLIKNWNFQFVLKLGGILILIVMAVLGLKLKFSLIQFDAIFMGFLVVWLLSHFVVMLGVAKLLNVNSAWVPIASMANVGGIATAPAVTAAYEKKWMPHAIILAVLSMATGTFWGLLTISLFRILVL
ncbi:MAG: DUF819 family protein [Flavobacteriaceae bacterium]|nr:DUF819 family protein [Flavobacteriaceae bacterium]MBT4313975.1 DUF819 family protein [Flavobacteriaceae bacterium]MBT5091125.1 DUF819 family protein [Flavobacteriaceae bacterium]MBT5282712.1 DUF819 family protein [Flavobacteriaceae bacterium]MBT5693750.1 DUF819 family protein [Flavobacteriaceae bacterium]